MNTQSSIRWGIDLGTTNSAIALFEGTNVQVIKNAWGEELTPSIVTERLLNGRTITTVGRTDNDHRDLYGQDGVSEFKKNMGKGNWYFEFPSTGRRATAVDLSAEIVRELLRCAKSRKGEPVQAALITVPEAFLQPARDATRQAGLQAGLSHVEIRPEPVAAALAYGIENYSEGETWLCYDLGGGTFDAALVRLEEGQVEAFAHEGIMNLGGKDLDAAIVEKMIKRQLERRIREEASFPSPAWTRLKQIAVKAKIWLSTSEEKEWVGEHMLDDRSVVLRIDQEELSNLEREVFLPTLTKCEQLISRNSIRLEESPVSKVILIGGPTQSPGLRSLVADELHLSVDHSQDALTVVARGAAVAAAGVTVPYSKKTSSSWIEEQDTEIVPLRIQLNYKPSTDQTTALIPGKLIPKLKKVGMSTGWRVEVLKITELGKAQTLASTSEVMENGAFFLDLENLSKGENHFRLVVRDEDEQIIEARPDSFTVTVTLIEGIQHLPKGIGVLDHKGAVIWFFSRGKALPAERTETLQTTKSVEKGSSGDFLTISVVEGNEDDASLNRLIGRLTIQATDLKQSIAEGEMVDVKISVDENRDWTVKAKLHGKTYLGDYGGTTDISRGKFLEEIQIVKEALQRVHGLKGQDEDIDAVILKGEAWIVFVNEALECYRDYPEKADKVLDDVVEIRKDLQSIESKALALLEWHSDVKNVCNANFEAMDRALDMVNSQAGDIAPQWSEEYEGLREAYDDAVACKQYEKAKQLALDDLVSLIQSNDLLVRFVAFSQFESSSIQGLGHKVTAVSDVKRSDFDTV